MTRVLGILTVLMALALVGCSGPSDAEIAESVRLEVERQVAEIEIPPGPVGLEGPEGQPGPQGIQGERGGEGLSGTRGDMGAPGAVGREGPRGVPGPQGERGDMGLPGPIGPQTTMPKVLEVEELIVRGQDGGSYMLLRAGEDGRVARVEWRLGETGQLVSAVSGGSASGLILQDVNPDGTWTVFCIYGGTVELCEYW